MLNDRFCAQSDTCVVFADGFACLPSRTRSFSSRWVFWRSSHPIALLLGKELWISGMANTEKSSCMLGGQLNFRQNHLMITADWLQSARLYRSIQILPTLTNRQILGSSLGLWPWRKKHREEEPDGNAERIRRWGFAFAPIVDTRRGKPSWLGPSDILGCAHVPRCALVSNVYPGCI